MDNKKILLVNLSKGRTGELNSKLLGMMFVMKFQAAAMSRANIPEDDRVDFALYVDEFQNFSTDSFATILSEARKFRLNLIVANQFTTQLTDEIRDAVFGNIGTIVGFRIGQNDVESLGRYFQPHFDGDDLLRIPNYNAVARTLVNGVPTQPFSMATLAPLGNPNPGLASALKQLSSAKYGRPKAVVEKEIFARLRAPSLNAFTESPTMRSPATATAPQQPAFPQQKSFLDEWLAKQQNQQASSSPTAAPTSAPMASQLAVKPSETAPQAVSADNSITDQPAALAPLSQPPTAPVAGNISSSTLDNSEVSGIAAELRKSLDKSQDKTVSLTSPGAINEDTIYIDKDGKFHSKGDMSEPLQSE